MEQTLEQTKPKSLSDRTMMVEILHSKDAKDLLNLAASARNAHILRLGICYRHSLAPNPEINKILKRLKKEHPKLEWWLENWRADHTLSKIEGT